jgi:hypothetical protein
MKRVLTIVFLLLLFAVAFASSMQEGPPLKGEVVSAKMVDQKQKNWELSVKLLEEPGVPPSGFYKASQFKKGTTVQTDVERSNLSFAKGDKVTLRWMNYSAMGPNGPVGGLSWQFLSKP